MTQAKLFLFDLDGTLIDTAPTLVRAVNRVLEEEHHSPLPFEVLRPYASQGAPGLFGRALGITKTHPDFPRLREAFFAHYASDIATGTTLFPGIEALLAALQKASIQLGVVTNKTESLTRLLLDKLALTDTFRVILGSDSVHCAMKPNPDSLLEALRLTDLPPELVRYAGDDARDILAAQRAHIPVAAITWGYAKDDPALWHADYLAHHPMDLYRWVLAAL